MSNNIIDSVQSLVKALEAGSYNAAPASLVQGAALQIEDVSPVMNLVTSDDKHIKLQKMVKTSPCKSTLAQFDRQLSYGIYGGSAQFEGNIGQEETSDFVRITVPMAFYSHIRRVTIVATQVATVDGKKADERAAEDAAKKIAGDIEFDLFRGLSDFSNAGTFDGNPLMVPALPNMNGLDLQIRQSDNQRNSQDMMFSEYGSDDSVVIAGGGTLTQDLVEDASVRSALGFGSADKLMVDPKVLSNFNKISFGKERIILAGSPQEAVGAGLSKQWVSGGTVNIEASQFLRGKAKPATLRSDSPGVVTTVTTASASGSTSFLSGEVYGYYISACNEKGESALSAVKSVTVGGNGYKTTLTIVAPTTGTTRYYNIYRTPAGGGAATAKFIGRVIKNPTTDTSFVDLGNRSPGFVTGFLVQGDTMEMRELSPYSRIKLAVTDLSQPEGHFRFTTLVVTQPRKNVLIDSLR